MKILASSPDGNAFAVMGYVRSLFFEIGRRDEWPDVRARMMSGDYANLCAVAKEVTNGSVEVVAYEEEDDA